MNAAPSTPLRPAHPRRPIRPGPRATQRRGVVLIFVVAVLVLLVILSTAFFSTIRSQSLLQANRRNSFQADLAAQSGLNQSARHLLALVNSAVMPNSNVINAYHADPTGTTGALGDGWEKDLTNRWYLSTSLYNVDTATGANQELNPPNLFTVDLLNETTPWPAVLPAAGGLDPTLYRWSWSNFWVDDKDRNLRPNDNDAPLIQPFVRNMTNSADIMVWPYFPRISLEHAQTPGELEQLTAAWSMGRRWVITPNEILAQDRAPTSAVPAGRPTDTDFFGGNPALTTYNPNFRYKLREQQLAQPTYPLELATGENPLSPPLTFSGFIEYRMVAADLDSRLYLPITRWIPEPLAGTPNDRLTAANRLLILKTLNDEIGIQINGAAIYNGANWAPAVVAKFAVDDGSGRLDTAHSWGDLWTVAGSADPSMDIAALVPNDVVARQQFLFRKYLVPREFNTYPPRFSGDATHGGNALNRPLTLTSRPALNINTATREVLAANFAAALQDDSVVASIGSISADDLAVRIMRCRPFFSQIDWQDFLAANLEESKFAIVLGNIDTRTLNLGEISDSGGPKGTFDLADQLMVPGTDTTLGGEKRLLWFRNQIAATGASRLKPKGFNALLSASFKSSSLSFYARTAAIVYEEDTTNPGNPKTINESWTENGVAKSQTIAKAKAGSWVTGVQDGIFEWNFTTDATLRPAWDTAGTYNYMVKSGGEFPDAWPHDSAGKAQPILIAMPIKLQSYLFEQIVRARYVQMVDHVLTVRGVSKRHAVYDTEHNITWMVEDLKSEKGALSDP